MKVYSILDKKSGAYSTPFFQPNNETAQRMFADEVNGRDGLLSRHSEDFILFDVGEFDEATGRLTSYDLVSVVGGGELKIVQGQ